MIFKVNDTFGGFFRSFTFPHLDLFEKIIDDAVASGTTKSKAKEWKQRLQHAVMTRVGELYFVCVSSRIRMSLALLSAMQLIQLFEKKTAPFERQRLL